MLFAVMIVLACGAAAELQAVATQPSAPSWAEGDCAVVSESDARGTRVGYVMLNDTGLNYMDLDAACCAACSEHAECSFWIRSTHSGACWLMKNWRRNFRSSYRRVGMKNVLEQPCKILKYAYGVLGNIVKLISFRLGKTITNLRLELPSDIQCVIANEDENSNQIVFLKNVAVRANTDFDLRSVDKFLVRSLYGTAQVDLDLDPELSVHLQTCNHEVTKLNLWNLGVGINNFGGWQGLTNWLSGSRHSGLKNANSCSGVISAYPSLDLAGAGSGRVAHIMVNASSQSDADAECCEACQRNPDCQGFVVQANKRMGPRHCWLKRLARPSKNRHLGFRGQNVSMGNLDVFHSGGRRIGYYKILNTTQGEIDARCASLCEAAEGCEIWITSTERPQCWLNTPFQRIGLINQGILGISGRSIANWLANRMMRRMMKKVLSYVCGKNAIVDINAIMHHGTEVLGDGEFALDVAADFFGTANFSRPEPYGNTTFPVLAASANISAKHSAVQPLVDDLVGDLRLSLMGEVSEQIGTPMGFFIGSLISECTVNTNCLHSNSDAEAELIV